MDCGLNSEIRRFYPETVVAIFASSTENNIVVTDDDKDYFITSNPLGYINEFNKCGQDSDSIPTRKNNHAGNNPYSTYLRPLTDLSEIFKAQKVYIEKAEFYAYDSMYEGSTYQNEDLWNVIKASRIPTSADESFPQQIGPGEEQTPPPLYSKTYAQSVYKNGLLSVNWQPNGFRPQIIINDQFILKGMTSSNYGNKGNEGDMSIGLPLPFCVNLDRELGKVNTVEAHGAVWQRIDLRDAYNHLQRYPIICVVTFWTGTGTVNAKNG